MLLNVCEEGVVVEDKANGLECANLAGVLTVVVLGSDGGFALGWRGHWIWCGGLAWLK